MGSIYVNWEGTCRERTEQESLVEAMSVLAEHSAARIADAPERPAFLQMMTGHRESQAAPVEAVRRFDGELAGRIVLDPCLAREGAALKADIERTGAELLVVKAGGTIKNEPFCLSLDQGAAQYCLGLPRIGVYGLDFQLFDPRRLYPSADRISFVFLTSDDLPALNGCFAQVESRDQCRAYASEMIRAADWYISAPNIHLRYYLEEWIDLLLAWVKFFHVPNFHYARYEPLSQYDAVRAMFEEMCDRHGREATRMSALGYLIEQFEKHADEWTGKLAEMG